MNSDLVTVMMPAHNAEKYIKEAIESVLTQTYSNWELVVVDDGSTDRTSEIVNAFTDPRIKLIHQTKGGEASARNTALRTMRGEFLAFLDADDLYLPHHLESAIDFFATHNHVNGFYSDGYYIDNAKNRLQTLSSRRRGPFEGDIFEAAVYASDIFGPPICVVLRTRPIRESRLQFDEDIVIGPDWDFFVKFAALTCFGYLDKVTCLYRLHTSNISILTGLEKRFLELAKCRINAINMPKFHTCSVETRVAVFYDLLVNLMLGFPERQLKITQGTEFSSLPKREQSRLYRLMATKAQLHEMSLAYVGTWLSKSRETNPLDMRGALLWALYNIQPKLLSLALRLKHGREIDPRIIHPFADMKTLKDS